MADASVLGAAAGFAAIAAAVLVRRARRAAPQGAALRASALLAVLAAGALLGAAGLRLTGEQHWLLAIPVALAAGWLFVADPLACRPDRTGLGPSDGRGDGR